MHHFMSIIKNVHGRDSGPPSPFPAGSPPVDVVTLQNGVYHIFLFFCKR